MRRWHTKLWMAWHFGWMRGHRCWYRLQHDWAITRWNDKHGKLMQDERCFRCGTDRHSFRLMVMWGIPGVWKITWLIKHRSIPPSSKSYD